MEVTTRIRKVYQPLSLSVSTKLSGIAVAQVYNQYEGTWNPSRSNTHPTVITPVVYAMTSDTTWENGNYAKALREVKWLANGVDISVEGTSEYEAFHEAGTALFEIVSDDNDDNGSIRIWKNCDAEENYSMQMSAKFLDTRTGRSYEVVTDGVNLTCSALGDSEWDFSIVHDVNIKYSPVLDRLKEYDWLVEKGETPDKKDYMDATGYDLNLPIFITHGHNKVEPTEAITFKLEDHLNSHEEITTENCLYLKELDKEHIRFDLRFMSEDNVVIDVKMYVNGDFQSQEQLTFSRYYPSIEIQTSNLSDVDLEADSRWDKALVLFNGKKVEHPEAFLYLVWQARASETDEWQDQGVGESVTIDQSSLKLTEDLFIRVGYRIKSGLAPISNEDGDLIENANKQIIVTETLKD